MLHTLLVLAIAPAIFFLWFFYSRDKYEKEPLRMVLLTFFLGMFSIIPAIILEEIGFYLIPESDYVFVILIHSFITIGLSEELCKLCAMIPSFRSIEFNEVMDGIVYGASAALGFATIENIFYVLDGGVSTGILRAIFSIPSHALNGVVMGYFIGLAKFNEAKRLKLIVTGLGLSVILHGFWDFFSMTGLMLGILILYIIGWSLFFRYRKLALKKSFFRNKYCVKCGSTLNKEYKYCIKCGELMNPNYKVSTKKII